MNSMEEMKTTCDWCLQEARVQTICEKLWRFWKTISTEDPMLTSHKNICDKCKSRYAGFSIYIERCKINTSKIDELLSVGQVKDEPSIDIEYPPLIKTETSNEVDSNSYRPAVSSGVFIEQQMLAVCSNSTMKSNGSMIEKVLSAEKVKNEPFVDIEDHLIIANKVDSISHCPSVTSGVFIEQQMPAGCSNSTMKSNDSTIEEKVLSAEKVKKEPFVDIEDDLINEEDIWKEQASDPDYPTASGGNGKDELVVQCVVLQRQIANEVDSTSYCPAVISGAFIEQEMLASCSNSATKSNDSTIDTVLSAGKVKKEPFVDIEDDLINEEDIWNEQASDPDYPTASGGKGKDELVQLVLRVVLERQLLPDSMVLQKKVNNNRTCTYCGKTFKSPCSLKIHLRTHTGDKPFKCPHCNKRFNQLGNLNVHLRIHTGDKPFKCPHCNKRFNQLGNLNVHLRIHTGDQPFKCPHCSKSFTRLYNLNVHLRIHTGVKPFKCPHCNKRFAHLSNLNVHLRIHTGDKPFKCPHCNKSFTQLNNLKVHLRIHTGDKPFKCPHCNKCFTQLSNVNVHIRTHTGDKPFKCPHCNKRFAHLGNLNVHLRIHTGDQPFKCSHCSKSFTRLDHLNVHLRIHTGNKPFKSSH